MSLILVLAVGASAATINDCDDSCTSGTCKVSVSDDLLRCCANQTLCDGEGPITLSGGGDLDLDGATIECACGKMFCSFSSDECVADSDCPASELCNVDPNCDECDNAAVVMQGTGSAVKDTGSGGRITGLFGQTVGGSPVIDCDAYNTSSVVGITIDGFDDGDAIVDCKTVKENVIVGTASASNIEGSGIASIGGVTASGDVIRDNYVADVATAIISTGTTSPTIDHNLIQLSLGSTAAMNVSSSGAGLEVENNIILGVPDTSVPNVVLMTGAAASSKFDANYCDVNENTKCATCISSGKCHLPTAPFIFP